MGMKSDFGTFASKTVVFERRRMRFYLIYDAKSPAAAPVAGQIASSIVHADERIPLCAVLAHARKAGVWAQPQGNHTPFAVSGIQADYSSTIWVPDSEWQQPILLDTMNVIDESNEQQFTVLFDRFEYLLSLIYADINQQITGYPDCVGSIGQCSDLLTLLATYGQSWAAERSGTV